MANRFFKVALIGHQEKTPGGYYCVQCSLKTLALDAEQIRQLLQDVDLEGYAHEEYGIQQVIEYEINGGGRFFPPVSRETVAQAMQGVELLIAVVSSWQLNWVYWEVFECMIEDNLMDKCVVVLKLMSDAVFKHGRAVITVDNAMENCGFIGDKWKGNAYIIAEKALGGKGIDKGIEEISIVLQRMGASEEVSQQGQEYKQGEAVFPTKRGQRLLHWMGRVLRLK